MKILSKQNDSLLVQASNHQRIYVNQETWDSFYKGKLSEKELIEAGIPYSHYWAESDVTLTSSEINEVLWQYGLHTIDDVYGNLRNVQAALRTLLHDYGRRIVTDARKK
jgi:hypothetical protein